MTRFEAVLKLEGKTATGIEVPPDMVQSLGSSKKPAVKVSLGEYTYRSTLALRDGKFMLPVSAEHRQGAGLAAGDTVAVTLELDTEPREVSVPEELAAALERNAVARQRFEALSYSQKRQHTLAIEGAKTPETRAKRIAKAVEALASGK
ncbi:YdeI/OmpD-associated family protein [Deinococcus sp.]|uniref:YdeI/OmpD-associated family protein n=1 Tax=Deinococcus sp. TaxID=47478 RepID=UPI003B59C4D9